MDRALTAIFESDTAFLGTLLDSESFGVDSADEEGNTLLHYAVACQRNDVVKLLCARLVDAPLLCICMGKYGHVPTYVHTYFQVQAMLCVNMIVWSPASHTHTHTHAHSDNVTLTDKLAV